jgi:hypothetical protein
MCLELSETFKEQLSYGIGSQYVFFFLLKDIAFEWFKGQLYFLLCFFIVYVENSSKFAPALKETLTNVVKENRKGEMESIKKRKNSLNKFCVNRKVVVCLPPVSTEVESRECNNRKSSLI